jgi:hypothetical protein
MNNKSGQYFKYIGLVYYLYLLVICIFGVDLKKNTQNDAKFLHKQLIVKL